MSGLSGLRVVFATTVLPDERANGGEICSQEFIDALTAAGADLRVVGYERVGRGPRTPSAAVYSAGPWFIEMADAGWRKHLWLARAFALGRPFIQAKFTSRAYWKALAAAIGSGADLLIIDHAHMGWIAELEGLPTRRAYVAHNVEHALYNDIALAASGAKARIYGREAHLLRKAERQLGLDSAAVFCLSAGDRDGLVSLGVPADRITILDLPGQSFDQSEGTNDKRYDIGMIGSWQWEINRQGILWFLDTVVPELPGDSQIAIAGSGSGSLPTDDARIQKLGRVPDAGQFMRSCRVLAVPTVVGSGIQLKTIEGISIGVPMVVTPMALRGISDVPRYVYVAQDGKAFAEALISAQTDAPPADTGAAWAAERRRAFHEKLCAVIAWIA